MNFLTYVSRSLEVGLVPRQGAWSRGHLASTPRQVAKATQRESTRGRTHCGGRGRAGSQRALINSLSYEAGLSDDTAALRKAASNLVDSQCWKQHLSGQAQLSHSSLDSHNQNQEAMFTPQSGLYTKRESPVRKLPELNPSPQGSLPRSKAPAPPGPTPRSSSLISTQK